MADTKIALRIVLITTSHWSWTKGKEFRRATGWPLRSLDRNQTWSAAPLIGLHELRSDCCNGNAPLRRFGNCEGGTWRPVQIDGESSPQTRLPVGTRVNCTGSPGALVAPAAN